MTPLFQITPVFLLRRVGPVGAALTTALAFTVALWVQRERGAWPFSPPPPPPGHTPAAIDLVPPTSPDSRQRVAVDTASTAMLGIRLETVRRQSLVEEIHAVATVVPDESRISHVHTRVSGWVEQLDVNTTGEFVRVGQPLARVFSQELLSSQTEYLAARSNTAAAGISSVVVASGRTRLSVLGMTAGEIDAIEESGEPKRLVTVVAPRSGVVVNRGVTVGSSVDASTTLLTIADLSRVWVLAEIPEANIPGVRVGTNARLDFPASGRTPFAARVDFIYPTLTERTRTLRVRLSVANPGGVLRPGLYGTATFASAGQDVIAVPRDAVVDTGLQQHVFVVIGDRFEPRPVVVGAQFADRVAIREGLSEGDQIVATGVFLLDSESRLRATGGAGGHNHGSTEPKTDSPGGQTPASTTQPLPATDSHAGHRSASANASPDKE